MAEDVLQDAARIAIEKAQEYDDRRSPTPWLRAIAQNVVRNRLTEKERSNRPFPVTDCIPRVSTATRMRELGSPTEQEEFDALLGSDDEDTVSRLGVEELLSLVGDRSRRVLWLALVERFKGKALAANLGIREGSAHVALNRAKKELREAYHEAHGAG